MLQKMSQPPKRHARRKGDAVTAPGVDTADDDFVESSQAEGRPVRSKPRIAHYKASSQGPRQLVQVSLLLISSENRC